MTYDAETSKIDKLVVDGLSGVNNSLAYKVEEIEKHLHSAGRWLGASAGNIGPGLLTSLLPFILTSNASSGVYGTAVEIFDGTEDYDLPFTVVYADPHQLFVHDVSNDGIFKIRFANSRYNGSTDTYANMAEAVAAKFYTEVKVIIADDKKPSTAIPIQTGRMRVGSTLWAQVMHDTASAETIEFTLGMHGYKG